MVLVINDPLSDDLADFIDILFHIGIAKAKKLDPKRFELGLTLLVSCSRVRTIMG